MLISSVLPIREKTNIIHKSTCNNIQDNTKYNKNFNNELKNSNYLNVFYIPNFKGNINPVCNYISSADALKIQTTEFVYEIERDLSPQKYAQKAIHKIFEKDCRFLDKHYFSISDNYDKFSKLGFIDKYLNFNQEILDFLNRTNQRKLANVYDDFFNKNLKSLEKVSKGDVSYTNLFLTNKIGNKYIVDLWLDFLGNNDILNNDIKIDILNKKLKEKYKNSGTIDDIAIKTIETYFCNLLHPIQVKTEDSDLALSLNNLLNIKNKLSEILKDNVVDDDEFKKIINDKKFINFKIKDKTLKSILLSQLNQKFIDDMGENLQDELLEEIYEDSYLRKQVVLNTLSFVRKNIISLKIKIEKEKQSNNLEFNNEFKNFDKTLATELFVNNSNEKAKNVINNIKVFEQAAEKLFSQMIEQNPFSSSNNRNVNEKLNIVFSLIDESLRTADNADYVKECLEKLADLSEALDNNNITLANEIWNNSLLNFAVNQWKSTHLPNIIKNKQNSYIVLENFYNKKKTNELLKTGIIDTFFNSDIVTLEQKVFLATKSDSSEFISLCNFLNKHVPSNQQRKVIIDKLIDNERITLNSYDTFKNYFISDVRAMNEKSLIYNKIIQGSKLCDLVLEQFVDDTAVFDEKQKISFLNNLTDEELSQAFENIKPLYVEQQFNCAVKKLSDKYDVAKQSEKILENLVIELNGQTYNLFDVMDKDFSYMSNIINNSNYIQQEKLDEVIKLLIIDKDLSENVYKTINLLLDKMIAASPANTNNIQMTRSHIDKIFTALKKSSPSIVYSLISYLITQHPVVCVPSIITTAFNIIEQYSKKNLIHNY